MCVDEVSAGTVWHQYTHASVRYEFELGALFSMQPVKAVHGQPWSPCRWGRWH